MVFVFVYVGVGQETHKKISNICYGVSCYYYSNGKYYYICTVCKVTSQTHLTHLTNIH